MTDSSTECLQAIDGNGSKWFWQERTKHSKHSYSLRRADGQVILVGQYNDIKFIE